MLRGERGRSYLEKIVQLQIPLPVTFTEELGALFDAELKEICSELGLTEDP